RRKSGTQDMNDPNCIFCKIAKGLIPAKKLYDDQDLMAFHDIRPQAPVHFVSLYEATAEHQAVLGKMLTMAGRLAREAGASDGFRTIINNGRVGHQEV